jgi:hypothetical protein
LREVQVNFCVVCIQDVSDLNCEAALSCYTYIYFPWLKDLLQEPVTRSKHNLRTWRVKNFLKIRAWNYKSGTSRIRPSASTGCTQLIPAPNNAANLFQYKNTLITQFSKIWRLTSSCTKSFSSSALVLGLLLIDERSFFESFRYGIYASLGMSVPVAFNSLHRPILDVSTFVRRSGLQGLTLREEGHN